MSATLSEIFERFAREEFRDASPLYERLALGIAGDANLLNLAAHCRKGERVPNLLFAAVHYLLLSGFSHPLARFYRSLGGEFDGSEAPSVDFRSFCLEHMDRIRALIAVRLVQTNEVSRCAGLMPLFVEASKRVPGRPLFLVDIGASAGLNLCWDQYGYKYGQHAAVGVMKSPVQIECGLRGANIPMVRTPFPPIVSRVGVDLNPLDVANEDDMLWLRALVWPEHEKRAELLRNAIAVARQHKITHVAGDGVERLPEVMKLVAADAVLCVMRVFTQIGQESRQRWSEIIAGYGTTRDIMVITARPHGGDDSELVLTSFVNGARAETVFAYMQNHGNWIEWVDHQ